MQVKREYEVVEGVDGVMDKLERVAIYPERVHVENEGRKHPMLALTDEQFALFHERLTEFDKIASDQKDMHGVSFNPYVIKELIGSAEWTAFTTRMSSEITLSAVEIGPLKRIGSQVVFAELSLEGRKFKLTRDPTLPEYLAFAVALVIGGCQAEKLDEVTGMYNASNETPDELFEHFKFWHSLDVNYVTQQCIAPWWMVPMTRSLIPCTSVVHSGDLIGLPLFDEDNDDCTLQSNIFRYYAVLKYRLKFKDFVAMRKLQTTVTADRMGFSVMGYWSLLEKDEFLHDPELELETEAGKKMLKYLTKLSGMKVLTIPERALQMAVESKTLLDNSADFKREQSMLTYAGKMLFEAAITNEAMLLGYDRAKLTGLLQGTFQKREISSYFRASPFVEMVEFQQNQDISVGDIATDAFYAIYYLSIFMDYSGSRKFAKFVLGNFEGFGKMK